MENMHKISNGILEVELCEQGGEMHGIKLLGKDRLWSGNPEFWKYHAPFLFPIVGRLKDNTAIIRGVECGMNQHGLSRLYQHDVVEKSGDSVKFRFSSDEETLKAYPYEFDFFTEYKLCGHEIKILITVANKGDVDMPFAVGAHPAFRIDLHEGDSLSDYEVAFEREENKLIRMHALGNGLLACDEEVENLQVVEISEKALNDTIIYRNFKSSYVSLTRKCTGEKITSSLVGHEIIAFWKAPDSPFFCIEPWNGIADPENASGIFEEKPYIEYVKVGKKRGFDFSIKVE